MGDLNLICIVELYLFVNKFWCDLTACCNTIGEGYVKKEGETLFVNSVLKDFEREKGNIPRALYFLQ